MAPNFSRLFCRNVIATYQGRGRRKICRKQLINSSHRSSCAFGIPFLSPLSPLPYTMLTLFHLCLLLTVFSTLVSAEPSPSFTGQTVYNNCSGEDLTPLPNSVASTSFFKPQVRVNSWDVNKHGIGWEEWNLLGHNLLPDGSIFTFSYKWARGDPTSANISHDAFIALAYFPNGTFYRQIVHDPFRYKENED